MSEITIIYNDNSQDKYTTKYKILKHYGAIEFRYTVTLRHPYYGLQTGCNSERQEERVKIIPFSSIKNIIIVEK